MNKLLLSFLALGLGSAATSVYAADAVNLSALGTANCYIVEPGSTGKFLAKYKGNSTTEKIGDVAGTKLLWQDGKSLVTELSYDPATGYITAVTGGEAGNALVAAIDADGKVLWSWHLWIMDYDPSKEYTTEPNQSGTQWTFMDRNLGATTMERSSFKNHGLIYQWGRKDPFPGAATYTDMNEDYTYNVDGEPELYDIDNTILPKISSLAQYHGTIQLSVENPMVFYAMTYNHTGELDEYGEEIVKNDYPTGDWVDVSDDDYWGGESNQKTIYDPSPVGYKVPVSDADGNTPYDWLSYAEMTWDKTNCGASQNGQWFPTGGTRVYASGGLDNNEQNPYTGIWFGTKGKASADLEAHPDLYGQYMFIINGKRTFKTSKDKRSQGMQLRCVRDDSFEPAALGNVAVDSTDDGAVYNIYGVKVLDNATSMSGLNPGLYITKGRKIMVK